MSLKEQLISSYTSPENAIQNPHLIALRKEAIEVFKAQGFPTTKDEEWKYTNLRKVLRLPYKLFPKEETVRQETISKYLIKGLDSCLIVFINGIYAEEFSTLDKNDFVLKNLSSAMNEDKYSEIISAHLGKVAPKDNGMVSLNTSYAKEGIFVYIPKGKAAKKIVQVLYLYTESSFNQPRNLIVLEDQSEVKIVERHQTVNEEPTFTNAVTEIVVGKESYLHYYKIQTDKKNASLVDSTFISQKEKSNATVFTFSFSGKLVRNNLNFYHQGEHLESNMYGITFLQNETLVDHHTLIEHRKPNCESRELYKSIYDEFSKGVFNGKVLVDKIAQKTNAYQQNDNVLLSENVSVDTKPQLEIFADDVLCSHGCTVGQLDESGMFYLRQRGIPEREARALLLFAFTSEIMEKVSIPPIKYHINKIISERLGVSLEF